MWVMLKVRVLNVLCQLQYGGLKYLMLFLECSFNRRSRPPHGDTFCCTLYVSVAGTLNICCNINVHIYMHSWYDNSRDAIAALPSFYVLAPVLVSAVSQNSSHRIVDGFRSGLFGSPQRIKVGWSLAYRTPVLRESEVLRLIRVIIYMPQISHSEPKVEVPINNTRGFLGISFENRSTLA